MLYNYDNFAYLQYRIRHMEEKARSLESGDAFVRMKKGQDNMRRYYERRISSMQRELEQARKETVRTREKWFEVFQDVQDEKEKNQTLRAQLGRDFQNSSVPSSLVPFRPKVPNNREKTNRKPGGQPGHEGHCRKKYPNPDRSVFLPAPEQIDADPDYYRQSGSQADVHKQVAEIFVKVEVTDYWSYQYRNRRTGAKYHPPFPEGVQLEMNYGESVKAFIFLMKNHLNVSEKKISEFLREVSGGKLCVSQGMVNGINREFAVKTSGEREAIFRKLVAGDVLHTDMTGARMNGKMKNIVVCTDGEDTLYFFRDTKGDKALKGTPVETFGNILVHDHDKTLYHYGGGEAPGMQ